jgi:hypothetical protein
MIFGRKKPKAKKEDAASGDGQLVAPAIEIKQMGVSRDEAIGLTVYGRHYLRWIDRRLMLPWSP